MQGPIVRRLGGAQLRPQRCDLLLPHASGGIALNILSEELYAWSIAVLETRVSLETFGQIILENSL